MSNVYIPVTPAGSVLSWLSSATEDRAWAKLLKDAAHMPYNGIEEFKQRGYEIICLGDSDANTD